ncbi:MAG TPA: hypothetical protein VFE06_18625 [Acidobacteriaceae bacterium]|jgi:hypothetical protein|nr:hypothetical protein [Acidobacteriaceae bacterium]
MDAHSIDTNFAFPDLATRALDETEAASDKLDFPVGGDEPLGVFRGLVAAAMIQFGVLMLVALGWQLWHFLR